MCQSDSGEKILVINQKVRQRNKKCRGGKKIVRCTKTEVKKTKKRKACCSRCEKGLSCKSEVVVNETICCERRACGLTCQCARTVNNPCLPCNNEWRCPNECGFICHEQVFIVEHQRSCNRRCPNLYANNFTRPCNIPYQTVCTWQPQSYHPAWPGCC